MSNLNTLFSSQKRKKKTSSNPFNSKIIGYAITLFAAILIFQIFRWQIIFADKFQNMAQDQYRTSRIQVATRGIITAADNTVLAVDEPVWNIYATLSTNEKERELFFSEKERFIAEVASILNMEQIEIEEKLTEDFVYAPLMKGVSTEKKKALEELEIFGAGTQGFGLYFENDEKRTYPNNHLASHVLGFIGKNEDGELVGQYGIQGYYYGDITGRQGYSYEERDSSGNVILTAEYEPILPREGKDFKLTIIPNIQNKVETILEEKVKESRAKSGSVIVMDPKTGAILAMANYPSYNPNEYWRVSEPWVLKNRAVSDVYEYGSVQKPITVAIALESGAIDKDYTCDDPTGYLDLFEVTGYPDLKGQRIYTWNKRAAGLLDLSDIFKHSNNPCAARIGLAIEFDEFYSALQDYGIGEFIGIGLQEEGTSYLMPKKYWTKLDTITASYGQVISATPLQLISAFSTFANKGVRMRPYIISEIKDERETIKIEPQVLRRTASEETANTIKELLTRSVQNDSLGYYGNELKAYGVVAKTGTAQIPAEEGGYQERYTNDTVIGFAPASDPKMIMLVKLQEPKNNSFASITTVPVWRDIFFSIADDMEIKRQN
ncbi:MAG: peptidoglycan D,D-transpeptidase FtsI family protein [Candidatus Dojkabacteria bacterium]|jgi:cell division protein FtsI/penicillin-binding protein 2